MRLPRLLLAGISLSTAVFLLSALFTQPPSRSLSAASVAVFIPLWYCLTAFHAGLRVASGFRATDEMAVFGLAFTLPATASLVIWWVSASASGGAGSLFAAGRTPVVLTAGVVLWAAVSLLVALLLVPDAADRVRSWAPAVVFLPLWLLVCGANALLGVFAVGYTWGEELLIMIANLSLPTVFALLAPWAIDRGKRRDATRHGAEGREPAA
ncbi:hypothetical protein HFP71_38640 [Streptomyces sp. ARC32]